MLSPATGAAVLALGPLASLPPPPATAVQIYMGTICESMHDVNRFVGTVTGLPAGMTIGQVNEHVESLQILCIVHPIPLPRLPPIIESFSYGEKSYVVREIELSGKTYLFLQRR